jgi:hypothetical protein
VYAYDVAIQDFCGKWDGYPILLQIPPKQMVVAGRYITHGGIATDRNDRANLIRAYQGHVYQQCELQSCTNTVAA